MALLNGVDGFGVVMLTSEVASRASMLTVVSFLTVNCGSVTW